MRRKMKFLTGILALVLILAAGSLVHAPEAAAKKKKVTVKKVSVSAPYGKTAYIAKGKKVKLSAVVKVTPNKKANKKVTYSSRNKKIAAVNGKGVVKAKKEGTTKIIVASKKNKKKKTAITVKVVKNAVKKVKLNKTNVKLYKGDKCKLNAKVSAKKGASKRVYFKSSNPSVADVSQKGVVTAKRAGTAAITAMAIDGSQKKSVCKVNVSTKKAGTNVSTDVNLVGMKAANSQVVTFSLNRSYALTQSKVILEAKYLVSGKYKRTLKIGSLSTVDYKNYTIVLDTDSELDTMNYVRLSIPCLNGKTKSLESLYFKKIADRGQKIIKGVEGREINESFAFYDRVGCCTYNIEGLPEGLAYSANGYEAVVKGTIAKAGLYTATLRAVDELENTYTETIQFCIGSENAIAATYGHRYVKIGKNGKSYVDSSIYVSGGSGSYLYSIEENEENFEVSSTGIISGYLAATGKHKFTVTVTDSENPAITTTAVAVMNGIQAYQVTGKVVDAENQPLYDADVYFETKNYEAEFYQSETVYTNNMGEYTAYVLPGNYDIFAKNYQTIRCLVDRKIKGTCTIADIKLPVYQVSFVKSNEEEINGLSWYDENENLLGSGSTGVYLQPGRYSLHSNEVSLDSSGKIGMTVKYLADIEVKAKSMTVVAEEEMIQKTINPVSAGQTSMFCDVEYQYYSFTPDQTAEYTITSESSMDTIIYLYDGESVYKDDDSGSSNNFLLTHTLEAGKTYYFKIRSYWVSGQINVSITAGSQVAATN